MYNYNKPSTLSDEVNVAIEVNNKNIQELKDVLADDPRGIPPRLTVAVDAIERNSKELETKITTVPVPGRQLNLRYP